MMSHTNRNISNYSVTSYILVARKLTFSLSFSPDTLVCEDMWVFIVAEWWGRDIWLRFLRCILTSKVRNKWFPSCCQQTCTGHYYSPGTSLFPAIFISSSQQPMRCFLMQLWKMLPVPWMTPTIDIKRWLLHRCITIAVQKEVSFSLKRFLEAPLKGNIRVRSEVEEVFLILFQILWLRLPFRCVSLTFLW